jgi:flagellar basal body-associated protein FliL
MENQKIIFVLLIVTVILSISSMIFVFSLNVDSSMNYDRASGETINSGNVQLIIEENLNANYEGNLYETK